MRYTEKHERCLFKLLRHLPIFIMKNTPLGRRHSPNSREVLKRKPQNSPQAPYSQPDSAYEFAYADTEFLTRRELRGARLQLEYLKPDLIQAEHAIEHTIVVFGSARFPSPEIAQTPPKY